MTNKCAILVLIGLLPASVLAMQPLDDTSLAQATGQDGVTVGLTFPSSTINYDQIALIDQDGMPGAAGAASVVMAPWTFNSTDGIRLLTSANAAVVNPITINIDADRNGTAPVVNVNVVFPSDLGKITMSGFSVYLAPDGNNVFNTRRVLNGAGVAKRAVVREMVAVDPVEILFAAGNAPKINIQLGNTPQGHMLMFTGGAIQQVYTPRVDILSLNGSTRVNLTVGDLTFAASGYPSNPSAVFGLTGFYADLVGQGVTFGKAGATDKFDLTIGSVKAGTAAAAANFNGLANGSMGGFGLIGARVTDLQVNVKGL